MGRYIASEILTVNGVCIHYAVAGEGRPVILVHGNGESHDLFDTETEQLVSAGYKVFAPDSRGHGANEPLEEYYYADMAEDMYCMIRSLKLNKPAFYGHSDGGIIGLILEMTHPGTLGVLAASGANLSPEGLDTGFLEKYTKINEESPDPLLTLMLTEPNINPEELRKIKIPVLITAGENDLIIPAETRRIADHLPNAELVILEGEDHGSYIDNSEIMGKLLIEFFNKEYS